MAKNHGSAIDEILEDEKIDAYIAKLSEAKKRNSKFTGLKTKRESDSVSAFDFNGEYDPENAAEILKFVEQFGLEE